MKSIAKIFLLSFLFFFIFSCEQKPSVAVTPLSEPIDSVGFIKTMQKHLDAVTNKDLESLATTLHPEGKMQLIVPNTEILYTAEAFLKNQGEWFAMPNWTFETKILNTEIKENLGMAVVETIYREPLRDGKPYFNRMIISYVLEKYKGAWYIIKDHAGTVEKSTD